MGQEGSTAWALPQGHNHGTSHWNCPMTCCYRCSECHTHCPLSATSQTSLTRSCWQFCHLTGHDEGLEDPCTKLRACLGAERRRRAV